jgi:hypothetical protein
MPPGDVFWHEAGAEPFVQALETIDTFFTTRTSVVDAA